MFLLFASSLFVAFIHKASAQTNLAPFFMSDLGGGKTLVTIALPANTFDHNLYYLSTNQSITINNIQNLGSGSGNNNSDITANFANGTTISLTKGVTTSTGNSVTTAALPSGMQYTGITSLDLENHNGNYNPVVTFTVYTPPTNSTSVTPVNSVVIPSDARGNVQIIMESSSDLVNWIPSLSGTYGSTYTNRFFRVRAVAQ
jgi:hypothetical protein